MSRKDCPAFNKICEYCGIVGHLKAVCKKLKSDSTSAEARVDESDNESLEDIDSEASVTFGFSAQDQEDFRLGHHHRPRR